MSSLTDTSAITIDSSSTHPLSPYSQIPRTTNLPLPTKQQEREGRDDGRSRSKSADLRRWLRPPPRTMGWSRAGAGVSRQQRRRSPLRARAHPISRYSHIPRTHTRPPTNEAARTGIQRRWQTADLQNSSTTASQAIELRKRCHQSCLHRVRDYVPGSPEVQIALGRGNATWSVRCQL